MRTAWSGTARQQDNSERVNASVSQRLPGDQAAHIHFLLHFRHLGKLTGPIRVIDRKATLTWRKVDRERRRPKHAH